MKRQTQSNLNMKFKNEVRFDLCFGCRRTHGPLKISLLLWSSQAEFGHSPSNICLQVNQGDV